jgi:hypothetical protein
MEEGSNAVGSFITCTPSNMISAINTSKRPENIAGEDSLETERRRVLTREHGHIFWYNIKLVLHK